MQSSGAAMCPDKTWGSCYLLKGSRREWHLVNNQSSLLQVIQGASATRRDDPVRREWYFRKESNCRSGGLKAAKMISSRAQMHCLISRDTVVSCHLSRAFQKKGCPWMHFQQVKVTLSFHLINQAITQNECEIWPALRVLTWAVSWQPDSEMLLLHQRKWDQFQSRRESTKLIWQMFTATKYPLQ